MSQDREDALLDAALVVLTEVGYDRLTVGAVCERAAASTKTAYRRWANKDELMAAAFRRAIERETAAQLEPVRTGSLRGDLIGNLDLRARSHWTSVNLVVGLVVASRIDGDAGRLARELVRQHEAAYCAELLRAAAERGEVRPGLDVESFADLARSFFLHELLVRGTRPDRARITAFVDSVLLPVCSTGEPLRPSGPPAGPAIP
ncbi:TetR/AcrR family transcriptional regulator [Frankia canadensis]|nr:TetR/AcrR family transcriptional regulator [Frankia canadensis]